MNCLGFWNATLYSNDIACDVRDSYIEFLEKQLSNKDAYKKTYEEYIELIGTDEEPLFWYSLADTQWKLGRLMPIVKEKALFFIQQKGGLSLWENNLRNVSKWEKEIRKLKIKISSPMPPEKKFPKPIEFTRNPWNTGDIYAYQFHTEKSAELNLFGKYILFQKIGNVEYYENIYYSVMQVFNSVFDFIPTLDMVKDLNVLPLIYSPGTKGGPSDINDYIPSFEWYTKTTMIYEKQSHYPRKHLIFIGNKSIPERSFNGNECTDFFWEKDGMEDWLIDYYISWQNVTC